MGCGRNAATWRWHRTDATIVAIDLDEALAAVARSASAAGWVRSPLCANLADLPMELAPADLIWAEGSAYTIGCGQCAESLAGAPCRPCCLPGAERPGG